MGEKKEEEEGAEEALCNLTLDIVKSPSEKEALLPKAIEVERETRSPCATRSSFAKI